MVWNDLGWDGALWRMPALRALPDEERVAVLEQARRDAATPQRVLDVVVPLYIVALVLLVAFFSLLPDLRHLPYSALWGALAIPAAARVWRDRVVRTSVRAQLALIRHRSIETIVAALRAHSHSSLPHAGA